MLLSLDVLFLIIIPLSNICKVSQFQLFLLFKFLSIWTMNLVLVSVLLLALIFFNSCLFFFLEAVILSDSTEAFVIVGHSVDASFFITDCILELNRLFKLLIHHSFLPMFPFCLRFQICIIIIQIPLNNILIYITLFTLYSILLLIIVSNYILKVVIQITLFLITLLSLHHFQCRFELDVLLHPLCFLMFLILIHLFLHFFMLNILLQFFAILLLHKLLSNSCFFLFSFIIFSLLSDHCAPFINLTSFCHRVIAFLIFI